MKRYWRGSTRNLYSLIWIGFIVGGLLISSCGSTEAPQVKPEATSEAVEELASPTAQPEPSATASPTALPPTSTMPPPTASPTDLPTPTLEPTATATPETAGPVVSREVYGAGGCGEHPILKSMRMIFCVVNIEVRRDGTMKFLVSWTGTFYGYDRPIIKRSDVKNPDMYIMDNLGNQYQAIDWGGEAARDTKLVDGTTYYGYFIYPPAKEGATSFSYHEADNGVTIEDLRLYEPMIVFMDMVLREQPLAIEFQSDLWTLGEVADGSLLLMNNAMPGCQVQERSTGDLLGKYKNTMALQAVTYEIYGWLEGNVGVREYRVAGGLDLPDPDNPPVFEVRIPLDEQDQCLNEAGTLLASLHQVETTP